MQQEDITIPVPWGHIAATTYGEKVNPAVILLHGKTLNSAVFVELIKLLPSNFYYISVDLPGHGHSSPFYQWLPITFVNFFVSVLHTMKHFQRDRYIFIAHSMGASIASQFTQIYPEKVVKLFLIDFFYCATNPPKNYLHMVRKGAESSMAMAKKPTIYTYKEIVKLIRKKCYLDVVEMNIAEQVAGRMIERVGDDQYVLTVDPRISSTIFPCFPADYLIQLLKEKPIKQPCVLIKTKDMVEDDTLLYELIKVHPNVKLVEMEGGHHIMQQNPKLLVPHIEEFLLGDTRKLSKY